MGCGFGGGCLWFVLGVECLGFVAFEVPIFSVGFGDFDFGSRSYGLGVLLRCVNGLVWWFMVILTCWMVCVDAVAWL